MAVNRRGTVTLYLVFFIAAILIITITAVLAPMGSLFNTKMVQAGERILLDANESIQAITNADIKASIQNTTSEALAAGVDNIAVNNTLFQYGWVFVLIMTALIVFLVARQLVEYGPRGGFQ